MTLSSLGATSYHRSQNNNVHIFISEHILLAKFTAHFLGAGYI